MVVPQSLAYATIAMLPIRVGSHPYYPVASPRSARPSSSIHASITLRAEQLQSLYC